MTKIQPSDDAIAIAAAHLAHTLIELRKPSMPFDDFAAHEKYVMNCYKFAVEQLVHERNA